MKSLRSFSTPSDVYNFFVYLWVLVAFVVFVTWSGYDEATKNLQMEASESLDIFHTAATFPESPRKIIQQGVKDYLAAVYNDEMPKMAEEDLELYSGGAHNSLRMLFAQVDASSIPNRELYGESLRCLNNLAQYRRMRIFAGNNTVPPVIWLVLLVGGVFAVSYTFFFGMKNLRAQYLITTTLTVTVTSILFLVYVLDHPLPERAGELCTFDTGNGGNAWRQRGRVKGFISSHVFFG